MGFQSVFFSALVAQGAVAQIWPFPDMSGSIKCDGTIRPDYTECEDIVIPKTFDGATVGPKFGQGSTFKSKNCQIRTVRCGGSEDSTFELSDVSSMYGLVRNSCSEFPAGGVYRSGDACVVIDTVDNPFFQTPTKRDETPPAIDAKRHEPAMKPRDVPERQQKQARRDAVSEVLDARCDVPDGPCYTYTEQTYITNVRGNAVRVCDNILPDGARCDKSKSVTTEESFSVSTDIGSGIKDIVEVSASFTYETSKSSTETLTTAITIDCPDAGYIVWYPLMQISRGECGRGPEETCNGGCITDTRTSCEYRQPVRAGEGRLSGEYDIQCV